MSSQHSRTLARRSLAVAVIGLLIGVLMAVVAPGLALADYCSTRSLGSSTYTTCSSGTSYSSRTLGGSTYHSGTIGGEHYSGSTRHLGGSSYHSGTIGGEHYSGTTSFYGRMRSTVSDWSFWD